MKRIIFILFAISLCSYVQSQTASVTRGCAPLNISFMAPENNEGYFWVFKDGTTSVLQNPEHIFTDPGDYLVDLYNEDGSTVIGSIAIKVYEDPEVTLVADLLSGCTPLEVNFTSIIESIDPELQIEGFIWSFGDGGRSTEQNPTYIYNNPGLMSVSVELQTNILGCSSTELILQYIQVEGPDASFEVDPRDACDAPLTVNIQPQANFDPINTYSWDFGNGDTSEEYDPGEIVYTSPGVYFINHVVRSPEPCVSSFVETVVIGKPPLEFDPPDTVCIFDKVFFDNDIYAEIFEWNIPQGVYFADSIQNENSPLPVLIFSEEGDMTFELNVYTLEACQSDTTFTIHVENPTAEFSWLPEEIGCEDPVEIVIIPDNDSYANYYYNGIQDGPGYSIIYEAPIITDSLHLNWVTTYSMSVEVETNFGCTKSSEKRFSIQRLIDAAFIAEPSQGCTPLLVEFTNASGSNEAIIRWTYIFGDGTTETYGPSDDVEHVYEQAGSYCVQLIIENEVGCIDTSACTWIIVDDPVSTTDYSISNTVICLDEQVDIDLPVGDNPALPLCYDPQEVIREYQNEPGIYELSFDVQSGVCVTTVGEGTIEVKGPLAKISYMVDCENPFSVMFESTSIDAEDLLWDFDGLGTSSDLNPIFTFPETGDYTVSLTALDTGNGCPASTATQLIHIRDVEAKFDLPERICDGEFVTLNAESSQDVHAECHKGYLWMFSENIPIQTDKDFAQRALNSGQQEITLIATDINGCRDTLTQSISIQNLMANFDNSIDRFCNGAVVAFNDLSQSDTTIVEWLWTFGEYGEFGTTTGPNPTFNFGELVPPNVLVTLQVTDAAGCVDDVIKFIPVYEFDSGIIESPEGLCVGEEGFFLSQDFTEEGSFLNFEWDMGNGEFIDGINPSYIYEEPGIYEVILTYTEESSGCFGKDTITLVVENSVESNFTTDVDGISPLCYPTIIEFFNESDSTDNVEYLWNFGEGSSSVLRNPTFAFGKGIFEVTLTTKVFGCENTSTRIFELVGPEGDIVIDDPRICLGEDIEFSFSDTVDVSTWVWDFGDGGELIENENPYTYTYDNIPDNGEIYVDLILFSEDNGCEVIRTDTVFIADLKAEFEGVAAGYCEGLAEFTNTSTGASTYDWDFGDGNTSIDFEPIHVYDPAGTYTVRLSVTDSLQICTDEFTQEIDLGAVVDLGLFPNVFSPNNDGRNDFFNVAIREEFREFVEVVTFKVFDRWGELIYNNETPTTGWDGNFDTKRVPAEVYAYYIEIDIQNCSTVAMKGNVTLIR